MAKRQDASTGEIVDVDDNKPITQAGSTGAEGEEVVDKDSDTLHVKVWSPFKVFYDDPAQSVSAENGTGPFDVLPHHHNFITLLNPCELSIKKVVSDKVNIKISGGVMHVHGNEVTVFLEV